MAFALDEALAVVHEVARAWAQERAGKKPGASIPEGQRLASDDDYDDADEIASAA